MKVISIILIMIIASLSGCTSIHGFLFGHAAEYRAEYETLKVNVLSSKDTTTEAKALHEMGLWLKRRGFVYRLSTSSQPNFNGVDLEKLTSTEPVELHLYARSDYEPRSGGFSFIPKDKSNLILLEGIPTEKD
jgi:uncharacterized protein YceK